jgi:hypothetical protein
MWLLLALVGFGAWLAVGVLDSVRKQLGERLARWLLPPGQAVTFRIAYAIARLAAAITPAQYIAVISRAADDPYHDGVTFRFDCPMLPDPPFYSGTFEDGEPWVELPVLPDGTRIRYFDLEMRDGLSWPRLRCHPWEKPKEAIAELDADLAATTPIAQPVHLVLPLIREAIAIQWQNGRAALLVARARWAIRYGTDEACQLATARIEWAGKQSAMARR